MYRNPMSPDYTFRLIMPLFGQLLRVHLALFARGRASLFEGLTVILDEIIFPVEGGLVLEALNTDVQGPLLDVFEKIIYNGYLWYT